MTAPQWGVSFYNQFVGQTGYSLSFAGGANILNDSSGYLSSFAIRVPYGGSFTATMPAVHFAGRYLAMRLRGPSGSSCVINFRNGATSVSSSAWSSLPTSWGTKINTSVFNINFDNIVISNSGTPGSNVDFDFFYTVDGPSDIGVSNFATQPFYSNEGPGISHAIINAPTVLEITGTTPYNIANPGSPGFRASVGDLWTIDGSTTISSTTAINETYTFTTLGSHTVRLDTFWGGHLADTNGTINVFVFPETPTFTLSSTSLGIGGELRMTNTTDVGSLTVAYYFFDIRTSDGGLHWTSYGTGIPPQATWTADVAGTYHVTLQIAYLVGGLHYTFFSESIFVTVTDSLYGFTYEPISPAAGTHVTLTNVSTGPGDYIQWLIFKQGVDYAAGYLGYNIDDVLEAASGLLTSSISLTRTNGVDVPPSVIALPPLTNRFVPSLPSVGFYDVYMLIYDSSTGLLQGYAYHRITVGTLDFTWTQPSAGSGGMFVPGFDVVDLIGFAFISGSASLDVPHNVLHSYIPSVTGDTLRLGFVTASGTPGSAVVEFLVNNASIGTVTIPVTASPEYNFYELVAKPSWTIGSSAEVVCKMTWSGAISSAVIVQSLLVGDSAKLGAPRVNSKFARIGWAGGAV